MNRDRVHIHRRMTHSIEKGWKAMTLVFIVIAILGIIMMGIASINNETKLAIIGPILTFVSIIGLMTLFLKDSKIIPITTDPYVFEETSENSWPSRPYWKNYLFKKRGNLGFLFFDKKTVLFLENSV